MIGLIRKIFIFGFICVSLIYTNISFAINAYDSELNGFQYPFDVYSFNLKTQNQSLNMRYMRLDAKDKSAWVILLHGKNFSGYYWERIAIDLNKQGYNVLIPDQIGWGKSSKPKFYQYSFSQLALNTKELIDSLSIERLIVVGHSMGGMLATHVAYHYPQLVDKLVLINPIGLENYTELTKAKDTNFFYNNELNKTPEKIRNYQKKFYYDGKWQPEYESLIAATAGQIKHEHWPKVAWNNALTYAPIFNEPIVPLLPKIELPIHLIIGTRDRTAPGKAWQKDNTYKMGQYQHLGKQAIKSTQQGKLYEIDGLGHMPQVENYDRFSEVFYTLFKPQ